jgi:hypothetical protein
MKVSELVAQLEGHQPDGHVVIQEIDAVSNSLFVVESVMKEEGKIPLLKVRAIGRNPYGRFPETLFKQAFSSKHNKYTAEIGKSPMDGKYRVTVDGSPLQMEGFETESEARIFLHGFAMGFASGTAETPRVNFTMRGRSIVKRSDGRQFALTPGPVPQPCKRFARRSCVTEKFLKLFQHAPACQATIEYFERESRINKYVHQNRN